MAVVLSVHIMMEAESEAARLRYIEIKYSHQQFHQFYVHRQALISTVVRAITAETGSVCIPQLALCFGLEPRSVLASILVLVTTAANAISRLDVFAFLPMIERHGLGRALSERDRVGVDRFPFVLLATLELQGTSGGWHGRAEAANVVVLIITKVMQ